MNEELGYILPEEDFGSVRELNNAILNLNELGHWECLSKDSFERIDGKYYSLEGVNNLKNNTKMPILKTFLNSFEQSNFVLQLKEFDRMYPIKQEPEEAFA